MKTVALGAVALALALTASAQDITSLPVCAQSPILTAFSASGCGLTDIACVCNNTEFINGLVQLIPSVCTAAEVTATIDFAVSLCASYGVTLNLPDTSGGSASTTPAITSELTPPTTATAEPTPTSSITVSSSTAVVESTNSPTTTQTPEVSSSTSSSVPAQYTGAGSKINTVVVSALFGVVALTVAATI
ncbi:hypothetical protein PV08_10062 [Exophiala spinifera]|uniref:CFEM domain-containing protein n=1 Tax=Exophiala spinifera TaxID=91928 RepID=A0A0D2AVK4_9EURO|nr:uncharacterized protein PV08_10062 [Exophiala spinifera]KIW10763.1 hypothetical protein PV08_10062 [Exophiala spinifera]